MKRDPIAQAYSGLTGKEQANLILHYANREDELEVARLIEAIPRVELYGPPIDFIRWSNALARLAAWWGVEYWKAQCGRSAAMGGTLLADQGDLAERFFLAGARAEGLIRALESALDEAAEIHGFDSNSIRAACHAIDSESIFEVEADLTIHREALEAIERILAPP